MRQSRVRPFGYPRIRAAYQFDLAISQDLINLHAAATRQTANGAGNRGRLPDIAPPTRHDDS
jgi:hypothetical protein